MVALLRTTSEDLTYRVQRQPIIVTFVMAWCTQWVYGTAQGANSHLPQTEAVGAGGLILRPIAFTLRNIGIQSTVKFQQEGQVATALF